LASGRQYGNALLGVRHQEEEKDFSGVAIWTVQHVESTEARELEEPTWLLGLNECLFNVITCTLLLRQNCAIHLPHSHFPSDA